MKQKSWIMIVFFLLSVVVLAGLHQARVADSTMRADNNESEMRSVRDQILRYESEQGALPEKLAQLVPKYLRPDQITAGNAPIYELDTQQRELRQVNGDEIRGLISYQRPPRTMNLPPVEAVPSPPAKPAPTPPTEDAPVPVTPIVDTPAVKADPAIGGTPVIPVGPERRDAPAGCRVFEAELFSETNYGWEAHPDPLAAGGAYLHCKEGIANGPGQTRLGVGNFYDIESTAAITYLKHHFKLDKAGNYFIYGRFWTTDTKCSNNICANIDKGGPYTGSMGNRDPFNWVWSPMEVNPIRLEAGDHYLHLFIHEDGVRIDQFLISPAPIEPAGIYRANLVPGRGTAWQAKEGPRVHLSFDYDTKVLSPGVPFKGNLVMRRLRESDGFGTVRAWLRGAGAGGGDVLVLKRKLPVAKLSEITFLPISFENVRVSDLPRKEFLLEAEWAVGDKVIARARTPLMRPFAWETCGPYDFVDNTQPGPLDGDRPIPPGDAHKWMPFLDTSWDHFGVLDFGLHTGGNSLHAPQQKMIYAQTQIKVNKESDYLLKMQADDQMLVWMDGKLIYQHDHFRPVTRAAKRLPIRLKAGVHRLRIRVNQRVGRWQASLRVRTGNDKLSDVHGLAPGTK